MGLLQSHAKNALHSSGPHFYRDMWQDNHGQSISNATTESQAKAGFTTVPFQSKQQLNQASATTSSWCFKTPICYKKCLEWHFGVF